jgi:hypothetical protein
VRRSITALGLGVLLAVAAVGIANATSGQHGANKHAHPMRISALHRPFHPTRIQRAQLRELRREFRPAPRNSAVASTVYDAARTVTIPGTTTDVWIAPDENGGVCTFIDDPLGGYGSACHTADVIASGRAVTMVLVGDDSELSGKALVAMVEPDGAVPPTVRTKDGTTRELPIQANVATAVVDPGETISANGNDTVVPQPHHYACAPPQGDEQFKRCS